MITQQEKIVQVFLLIAFFLHENVFNLSDAAASFMLKFLSIPLEFWQPIAKGLPSTIAVRRS